MASGIKCAPPLKPVPKSIIGTAVGIGQANKKNDVLLVQQLLNAVAPADGGPNPPLKEDGIVGPKTSGAIQTYQRKIMSGFADGRVDPGGKTINGLRDKVLADAEVGKIGLTSSFPDDRFGGGAVPEAIGILKIIQPRLNDLSWKLARRSNAVVALMSKHFVNPGETLNPGDIDYVQDILQSIRVYLDRANIFGSIEAVNVIQFSAKFPLLGFTVRGGDKMSTNEFQIYAESDGTAYNYPGQSIFITHLWKATYMAEKYLTIIHEFCHFVGDRDDPPAPLPPNPNKVDDIAYVDNPSMMYLNKSAKLHNAESLALFFMEYCVGTQGLLNLNPNPNRPMIDRSPRVSPSLDIITG